MDIQPLTQATEAAPLIMPATANAIVFARQDILKQKHVAPDIKKNITALPRVAINVLKIYRQNQLIRVIKPADGSGTQKVKNGLVANAPAVMAHHAPVTTELKARVAVVNVVQQVLAASRFKL